MTYPVSDHHDGERFFNPSLHGARPLSSVPKMMSEPRAQWPRSLPVRSGPPVPHDPSAWLTITFVGHSTFIIQTRTVTLITDPVFSERASPLPFIGPKRVRAAGVPLEQLPPIDLVLLSHNHYDHCDLASLGSIAGRFDPVLVTPLGNAAIARRAGFRRVEERDWWEAAGTTPLPVTVTPAQHFSARTPFDRNRGLWGSFVVEIEGRRLYFGGDSGYAPHFREIRERHGAIDLALLPIGAYEPRWFMGPIHMNPEEAVRAHLDLGASRSIGMHFGTFQLTTESIDEPVHALRRARTAHEMADATFDVLDFGATLRVHCAVGSNP
ncbi:MAG: MBL fold metallo-hydrolase [Vicinamibacterales bacterium]